MGSLLLASCSSGSGDDPPKRITNEKVLGTMADGCVLKSFEYGGLYPNRYFYVACPYADTTTSYKSGKHQVTIPSVRTAEAEREAKRLQALSKLTEEEQVLLGIPSNSKD